MIFRTSLISGLCLLLASCGGGGGGGSSSSSNDGGEGGGSTTPANNAPSISSPDAASVAEGKTAVITIEASDEDSEDTLSIGISGDDAALFELGVCNTSRCTSNTLSFVSAPDYETPADVGSDNIYNVIVAASDGEDSVVQTLSITVTNVAPTFSSTATASVTEGQTAVMSLAAVDPASDSGNVLSYSLAGDDAALFALSDTNQLSFLGAPDFENPADQGQNNTYKVTLTVTDGELSTDQVLAISISDAFEGRVVDGPIAGATVFADLNGNLALDAGEPSGASDSNGFFKFEMFNESAGVSPRVIAKGGVDAATGTALDSLTLISDVPTDKSLQLNVTPITTVIASVDADAEKQKLLTALGISGGLDAVLTTDTWAGSQAGDSSAVAVQRLNQQIGQIMLAAANISESSTDADPVQVSLAVGAELADQAVDQGADAFTTTETLQSVLKDALEVAAPSLDLKVQDVVAIASSLGSLNAVIGTQTLNPSSADAVEIAKIVQADFATSVSSLISGESSTAVFSSNTASTALLANTEFLANSADTDSDGVADVLDAFPLDSTETTDTDSDGIGNVQDPDDDGDGVNDSEDLFPLNFAESQDIDGDGLGNNSDLDDDGDGVADINDALPMSAANITDTDGDGVADLFDVRPNDATVTKAVEFNLSEVASLGFGEAIDLRGQTAGVSERGANFYKKLISAFLEMLLPEAHASTTLGNLTNTVTWDLSGNLLTSSILSSETLFIAETATSPDGEFLYLLTSNHIQRAIPQLDQEVCSIYRVKLSNMAFDCLLDPRDGDIEPKSLIGTQVTDFARRGIAFRSDGAAVMQGFNWNAELPEGVNGGTQSTTAWFMDKGGELTPIPQDFPYFAKAIFWLNDEAFAVAEFASTEQLSEGMNQERFAIYSADTLQRTAVIEDGVTNFGSPMVQKDGDIYYSGSVLRGDSLVVENSGGEGYPLLDTAGDRLLFLVDYIQSQRDEAIRNSDRNRIFSLDGEIRLELSEGDADWYEGTKQSGTGTDIKYPPVAFTPTHIAHRKSFEPTEPIQTLEGENFRMFTTYELANNQGSVEIQAARDIFLIRPSASHTGDLSINYEVLSTEGLVESRTLTIQAETIANWRADGRPRSADDYLEWASPNPQREGFCVYEFATKTSKCVNFSDYESLAVDMEYFRSTRYDANAVYPNGSGNAFPGVQNLLLAGGTLRVFFKDTTDHTYYQASAPIDAFMGAGEEALTFVKAVNGAGDSNILSDAVDLLPLQPELMPGITLEYLGADRVSVDFGQSLSSYGQLPSLDIAQKGKALQLGGLPVWSENRQTVTFSYSRLGVDVTEDVSVSVATPIFLPGQTRQYRPAYALTFRPDGENAFAIGSAQAQVQTIDRINGQTVSTNVALITDGDSLLVDAREVVISKALLDSGVAQGGGLSGSVAMPLAYVPVGEGEARMSVTLTEQGSTVKGRQLSASFVVNWSGNGVTGNLAVPAQTVTGDYIPVEGPAIEFNVATADLNVLQINDVGNSEPTSLVLSLESILAKIQSIARVPMIATGEYHVAVETELPLADAANNPISKLEILVSIGD